MSDEYWEPQPVRTDYKSIVLLLVMVAETSVMITASSVVQTGGLVELFIKDDDGEDLRVAAFNDCYGWMLAVAEVQQMSTVADVLSSLSHISKESKTELKKDGKVLFPRFHWKPEGDDEPPEAS